MRCTGAWWVLIAIVMSCAQDLRAEVSFGPREKVTVVNSASENETAMSLFALPDDRTEVMLLSRSGGNGIHDFWQSSRVTPAGDWSRPVLLGLEGGLSWFEGVPHATADGLTLLLDDGAWFDSSFPHRPHGLGQSDIWIATRETTEDEFGVPENLSETINSRYHDGGATLSGDGLNLFFESARTDDRVGGTDLWMASRGGPDMAWNDPVNLGEPINSRRHDINPAISSDGLRLFFSSNRSGNYDIWMSTRDNPSDPWNDPVQLDENINHPEYMEASPAISPDGSTLYFAANRSSSPYVLSWDIYEAPILFDTEVLPMLLSGDADQDLDFDQLDLVQVQLSAKYLTGLAATWGEGDWNGAPGGSPGNPPDGDGQFNQIDIVASQQGAAYLTGPYAAVRLDGMKGDEQTSLIYDASTGELAVDSPRGTELTSINVTSTNRMFIGSKPVVLDGAFDNFSADNLFKATFGGSFGAISFGNILPIGVSESALAEDLSAVGSLAGGGDLGDVDLVYIPEPTSTLLVASAMIGLCILRNRR